MSTIDELKPAGRADVVIYIPYYAKTKHDKLAHAIALYRQGSLEGQRQIEGGESIPLSNSEFIDYLIDVIINFKRSKVTDFPGSFYRKLLRFE